LPSPAPITLNDLHTFVADGIMTPRDDPRGAPPARRDHLKDRDAVLFENRTWHASGINLSGRPRIALMLQYGYR